MEGVGVVDDTLAIAFLNAELVVGEFFGRDRAFKKVRMMHRLHRVFLALVGANHPSSGGFGQVSADNPAVGTVFVLLEGMGAENLEGVVVLVVNDEIDLFAGSGCRH